MMNTTRKTKGHRPLFLIIAIVLLSIGACLAFIHTRKSDVLNIETFRVSGGWGYNVLAGERIFIYQPFIPGIPGKKPFPDKKSALVAARMVKSKLKQGKIPSLTREDIMKSGLDSLGNSK
jgi:hypothetical protein